MTTDENGENNSDHTDVDLSVLLERIRARYKLLCSSLALRPRLAVAGTPSATPEASQGLESTTSGVVLGNGTGDRNGTRVDGLVQGQQGSGVGRGMVDGVDTKLLRF